MNRLCSLDSGKWGWSLVAAIFWVSGCASTTTIYELKPRGKPSRFVEGAAVVEMKQNGVMVEFVADPIADVPACIGISVNNQSEDMVSVDPNTFVVKEQTEGAVKQYNAAVTEYKAAVAEYMKAYDPYSSPNPPRPKPYIVPKLIDPESLLAEMTVKLERETRLAKQFRSLGTMAWIIGGDTGTQVQLQASSLQKMHEAEKAQDMVEIIRSQWLRRTDLKPGESVRGLTCIKFAPYYTSRFSVRLPFPQNEFELAFELNEKTVSSSSRN